MKNMSIVPCPNEKHEHSALYTYLLQMKNMRVYIHANEKHVYSALYTYLLQMKNMSTVPCIHT